ncbi:hypothetical protein HHK36_008082 [Tetracentron sinense]|uniref:Protein LNK1 n=1 Tax=Tetracentron sinense TaxID=13715 RepID=A0A834ZFW0_TETSI|nr:hypothetical protein HHK36_008082 [Tetracentron sinense]
MLKVVLQLEDIMWDKFGESDDHIVPHPGDEKLDGDCHKKPRREVISAVTQNASKIVAPRKQEISFPTLEDKEDTMLEKGLWSDTPDGVFSASCDSESIKEVTRLASNDTRISGHCFKSSNMDAIGDEFCADDSILSDRCAAVGNNLCQFPLGISQADSDLEFFGNDQEDKGSSGFLYCDWPDIGNFEDVDWMFRSCDSTFGLENASSGNELSWFSSSSHAIDGFEDALKSGFKSSCSESSALKSTLEHHEGDIKYMPNHVTPLVNGSSENNVPNTYKSTSRTLDTDESAAIYHSSCANWLDANAENKGEFMSKELAHEINGAVEVKMSPVTQTNNGSSGMINFHRKQSKHKNQSEGKREDRYAEHLSASSFHNRGAMRQFTNVKLPSSLPSSQQGFPSPGIRQQKQNAGTDSLSYLNTSIPYVPTKYNHTSDQIPLTSTLSSIRPENKGHPSLSLKDSSFASNHAQSMERSPDPSSKDPAMKMDVKVEKVNWRQEIQGAFTIDPRRNNFQADQVPVRKQVHKIQNEVRGNSEVEGVSIENRAAEVDSSNVQESSCMSSVLDEISLEATSFRHLQYVMEQLDIRTKLCIRDSLYRLARSAEQRRNFGNSNGNCENARDITGVLTTEESDKCTEFMDVETDTNPIDRSIAHLLFRRPSDPSLRPVNDALSLESQTMIHGSITSQPVMAEKLVCQEEIAGGENTKSLIADQ